MFSFPQIDPETTGRVTNVPVPLNDYLSASYGQGQHDSAYDSVMRMSEMHLDEVDPNSPILDADTANKLYAVGDLKFDQPVKESVASTMNDRKRAEMDRQFYLFNGSSAGRFAPGMAASILGGVSNPLDLGLMFAPIVGEDTAAEKIAAAGGGVVRQSIARGLVSREALQLRGAPRLLAPIIQGAVGQSLFEIPNLVASMEDRADYTLGDSLRNIISGGLLAGTIHQLGYMLSKFSRGTKDAMANQAVNQFLRDEEVRVQDVAKLDESSISSGLLQDSHIMQFEAQKYADELMPGLRDRLQQDGEGQIVAAAIKMPDGEIATGANHADAIHSYSELHGIDSNEFWSGVLKYDHGFLTDSGRFVDLDEASKMSGRPVRHAEEMINQEFPRSFKTQQQVQDSFFLRPDIQQKLDVARQQTIQDFIDKQRIDRDPKTGMTQDQLKEVKQQRDAGITTTRQQVEESQHPEHFDESESTKIESENGVLEKELRQSLSDEERESAQLELDDALEKVGEPQVKPIQVAVDCIIKKIV